MLDNILKKINYVIGYLITGSGVLGCIIIINKWTVEVPSYLDVTYTQPHPYRWIVGFTVLILSFLSGVIFISIGKIMGLLSGMLSALKQPAKEETP